MYKIKSRFDFTTEKEYNTEKGRIYNTVYRAQEVYHETEQHRWTLGAGSGSGLWERALGAGSGSGNCNNKREKLTFSLQAKR